MANQLIPRLGIEFCFRQIDVRRLDLLKTPVDRAVRRRRYLAAGVDGQDLGRNSARLEQRGEHQSSHNARHNRHRASSRNPP
jgi:hypothetical protein